MPASMKDRRKDEAIALATDIATMMNSAPTETRPRITIRGSAAEISIVGISRQRLNMDTRLRIRMDTTTTTTATGIGTVTMIEVVTEIVTETAIVTEIAIVTATTIAAVAIGIVMGG